MSDLRGVHITMDRTTGKLVFFVSSELWFRLKYIYAWLFKHAEQTNGYRYMQNFTLVQTFVDSCLQNDPFFLISRIRASRWKNTPFWRKCVRVWYTFWSGVGAGHYHHNQRYLGFVRWGIWAIIIACISRMGVVQESEADWRMGVVRDLRQIGGWVLSAIWGRLTPLMTCISRMGIV